MTHPDRPNMPRTSPPPPPLPPPPPPSIGPPPPRVQAPAGPPEPPSYRANSYARSIVALIAAMSVIAGLGIGGWFLVADHSDDDSASTMVTAGVSPRAVEPGSGTSTSITTTAEPMSLPTGATVCPAVYGPVGAYTSSAAGTLITSCPFAEEVRIAYASAGAAGGARRVQAFSPVTRTAYDMDCAAGRVVTCRGGNDAVVYVY